MNQQRSHRIQMLSGGERLKAESTMDWCNGFWHRRVGWQQGSSNRDMHQREHGTELYRLRLVTQIERPEFLQLCQPLLCNGMDSLTQLLADASLESTEDTAFGVECPLLCTRLLAFDAFAAQLPEAVQTMRLPSPVDVTLLTKPNRVSAVLSCTGEICDVIARAVRPIHDCFSAAVITTELLAFQIIEVEANLCKKAHF